MKKAWTIGIVALVTSGLAAPSPAAGQGELERLELGIRASNGSLATAVSATQRVYLGARADSDIGGIRILSVSSGGPADRAGLLAQDLVVGAAGHKTRSLAELSTILNGLNPGDRVALEILRGNRPLRTEVVLGTPLSATQPGSIPPPVPSVGRTESIPPPPGAASPVPSLEGPAISVPNARPVPPNNPQAQIDGLRRRVEQLERRVEELERALAESRRK